MTSVLPPALADLCARIDAQAPAYTGFGAQHGRVSSWSGHARLTYTALERVVSGLLDEATAHLHTLDTALWGMQGWALRTTKAGKLAWERPGTYGQGIELALDGQRLATLAGMLAGATMALDAQDTQPDAAVWRAIAPRTSRDHAFLLWDWYLGEFHIQRGQTPLHAHLTRALHGHKGPLTGRARASYADAYARGATHARAAGRTPFLWCGARAFWTPLFSSPTARACAPRAKTPPPNSTREVVKEWPALADIARERPKAYQARHAEHLLGLTLGMAHMAALVPLAGPPAPKSAWLVQQGRALAVVEAWNSASAVLTAALERHTAGQMVGPLHTWQAFSIAPATEDTRPPLAALMPPKGPPAP